MYIRCRGWRYCPVAQEKSQILSEHNCYCTFKGVSTGVERFAASSLYAPFVLHIPTLSLPIGCFRPMLARGSCPVLSCPLRLLLSLFACRLPPSVAVSEHVRLSASAPLGRASFRPMRLLALNSVRVAFSASGGLACACRPTSPSGGLLSSVMRLDISAAGRQLSLQRDRWRVSKRWSLPAGNQNVDGTSPNYGDWYLLRRICGSDGGEREENRG